MQTAFQDLLDHAFSYGGEDATAAGSGKARRAVQEAYRLLPSRHEWSYLWSLGRVNTVPTYAAGTVAVVASTRGAHLTGGVWPAWAGSGTLVFDNVPHRVASRVSDTVLLLGEGQGPPADAPAGTTYSLYEDCYALPADFVAVDEVVVNEVGTVLTYRHPRDWSSERRTNVGPGQPWMFTVVGDPNVYGGIQMCFWPPPDGAYAIDFLYRRRMRPMVFEASSAGLVAAAAGSTGVTGTGTVWDPRMVGSLLRFGHDNAAVPTGDGGPNPAVAERRITGVASPTALSIDAPLGVDLVAVAHVVTDPADIDPAVMGEYLLREVELQYRAVARMKPTSEEPGLYQLAMQRAMEGDNRNTARRSVMRNQTRRSGFVHYPINFGV